MVYLVITYHIYNEYCTSIFSIKDNELSFETLEEEIQNIIFKKTNIRDVIISNITVIKNCNKYIEISNKIKVIECIK